MYIDSAVSALRSAWVIYDVFCTMFMLSRSSFSASKGLVDDSALCSGVR